MHRNKNGNETYVEAVLIYSPCWVFSFLSFVLFLPKIKGGKGVGPASPSPGPVIEYK